MEDSFFERQARELMARHHNELLPLMQTLNLSEAKIVEAYIKYNGHFEEFDNDIYDDLGNRFVLHLHNLLPGSWNQRRQQVIQEFVAEHTTGNLADIGFGVPSLYTRQLLSQEKGRSLLLCDCYEPAFVFAEALLSSWAENWREQIQFFHYDFNAPYLLDTVKTLIMQDSLEHAKNPSKTLQFLVDKSHEEVTLVLSLPICKLLSVHNIAWLTDEEALDWLQAHQLVPIRSESVYINLAVDAWAEDIGPALHNLCVVCKKAT